MAKPGAISCAQGRAWTSSTTCVLNGTLFNIVYYDAAQHRSRALLYDHTRVALPRHMLTCEYADPHAVDLAAVDVFDDNLAPEQYAGWNSLDQSVGTFDFQACRRATGCDRSERLREGDCRQPPPDGRKPSDVHACESLCRGRRARSATSEPGVALGRRSQACSVARLAEGRRSAHRLHCRVVRGGAEPALGRF
jgi:hypothetical protein